MRGAASNHDDPVNPGEIKWLWQGDRIVADIGLETIGQHGGLFMDFFGHEVLVAALFDLRMR